MDRGSALIKEGMFKAALRSYDMARQASLQPLVDDELYIRYSARGARV
jgi:hypothetical protein